MADNEIRNKVVTEFSAEGMSSFASKATGAAAALGAVAIGQHLFNSALAAAAAPINTIISLNVQRESQIRSMASALVAQQAIGGTRALQATADAAAAGSLDRQGRAIDFTNQQLAAGRREFAQYGDAAEGMFRRSATSSGAFLQATQAAQQMMRMMVTDAAALPGEVNDYATAMQIASSSVIQAVSGTRHSNTADVMHFVNNLTAAAINSGIDSGQAGRDIMRMMSDGRGQAGLDVRTWTEVVAPYARGANGQQLSSTQFNTLSAERRFEVLARVGETMRNIMNNSADSWEAVTGALTSARDELIQGSTLPIYKQIQSGLVRFAQWLNEGVATGHSILQGLQRVGEYLSTQVTKWFDPVMDAVARVGSGIGGMIGSLTRNPIVNTLVNMFGGVATALQQWIIDPTATVGSVLNTLGLAFSIFNPWIIVAVGFIQMLIRGGSPVMSLFNGVAAAAGFVFGAFMLLKSGFDALVNLVAGLWDSLAAPIGATLAIVGALLYGAVYLIMEFLVMPLMTVATLLLPVFSLIVEIVMFAVDALVTFGSMIFQLLAIVFPGLSVMTGFSNSLKDLRDDSIFVARSIREAFEELKSYLGIQSTTAILAAAVGVDAAENPTMARLRSLFGNAPNGSDSQRLTGPRNGAVSHTNNDFRFSRFDITQRFAEGFDPDRIATFFQRDIANAANHRLDPNNSPAFST